MKVEAIEPHGFCQGVKAAVEKAGRTLDAHKGCPVYCLHQLVHNEHVVAMLESRGMVFVDAIDAVPEGAVLMFSAHGVSPSLKREAAKRGLEVIDATCPFVDRAHARLRDFAARGVPVAIVGREGHVEVQGLVGEMEGAEYRVVLSAADVAALPFDPARPVGVVCQTTLSVEETDSVLAALGARYPLLEKTPSEGTCFATRDRQAAVRAFVRGGGDGVLVLGSEKSSNTLRLVEVARAAGARAWRAGTAAELSACSFEGVSRLGVTSGASTPEEFFDEVMGTLAANSRRGLGANRTFLGRLRQL